MTKKHRAILVGCGRMSGSWLSALRDHFSDRVELVALVDLHVESAIAQARSFGLAGAWTGSSLEEALAETGAGIVFNCTVPEAHLPVCRTAMRHGCDVLTEKPLAPSVAEAREMLAVSAGTGRLLAVIQNQRYAHGAAAVRAALAGGEIGAVHTALVDFFIAPRFGGFREVMPHPLLLDMAIHTFDQGRHFLGVDAESVSCVEYNPPCSWFGHAASAVAHFCMHGGATFSYRGSWCARGFATDWTGSWRIIGETGTLLWDGAQRIGIERLAPGWNGADFFEPLTRREWPPGVGDPAAHGHAGNIRDFLDALDTGSRPLTVAADNIRSLAMVEAAITAAGTGAPALVAQF